MASKRSRQWVSGGELVVDQSLKGASHGPGALKRIVVDILQEGESVTRALKRLRPAPQKTKRARNQRERELLKNQQAADEFLSNMDGDRDKNLELFNRLTEAASELLDLGFEDIYQDTREQLAATLDSGLQELKGRSMYVWHDDGTKAGQERKHHMYRSQEEIEADSRAGTEYFLGAVPLPQTLSAGPATRTPLEPARAVVVPPKQLAALREGGRSTAATTTNPGTAALDSRANGAQRPRQDAQPEHTAAVPSKNPKFEAPAEELPPPPPPPSSRGAPNNHASGHVNAGAAPSFDPKYLPAPHPAPYQYQLPATAAAPSSDPYITAAPHPAPYHYQQPATQYPYPQPAASSSMPNPQPGQPGPPWAGYPPPQPYYQAPPPWPHPQQPYPYAPQPPPQHYPPQPGYGYGQAYHAYPPQTGHSGHPPQWQAATTWQSGPPQPPQQ